MNFPQTEKRLAATAQLCRFATLPVINNRGERCGMFQGVWYARFSFISQVVDAVAVDCAAAACFSTRPSRCFTRRRRTTAGAVCVGLRQQTWQCNGFDSPLCHHAQQHRPGDGWPSRKTGGGAGRFTRRRRYAYSCDRQWYNHHDHRFARYQWGIIADLARI